jgi:hypothetical protein
MSDGMFTHTIKSLWQDMPGGGDWHFVWAKAEEQTKKANAAGTISFAIIVARPKRGAPIFPYPAVRSNNA